MAEVKIRNIRPSDSHFACDMIRLLGHENDVKSMAWRITAIEGTPRERVIIAEVDGQSAALASLNAYRYFHVDGLVCRVTALVVHPDFRKHGIGKTLIRYAEVWALEQGCDRVEVTARKEHADAMGFLLKLGYEDTSRRFFKHLGEAGSKGEV